MKNTRRILSGAAALMIIAGMLSGCGSNMDSVENAPSGGSTHANLVQADESYDGIKNSTEAAIAEAEESFENGIQYTTAIAEGIVDLNTEEFNYLNENGYKSTAINPLSTFSADVDTASYTTLRKQITEGRTIYPDAIRIEEMINYFSYDYPQPMGDEPFSVTAELSDCPWNKDAKLMLIGLQAEEIDLSERAPMNLVFLIDVSGSMYADDKLPLVQKSFSMLTENLSAADRISIVTYAGADEVVLEGADGNDKAEVLEAINSLKAGGSTAGAAGINTAYEIAEKYFIEGGNNRIILATDGDLNVGISSESGLTALVEEKRQSGVFLSVLGFGTGNYKDNKMEALADNGNGNYSYIDSELEAKKVLVGEMGGTLFTVAKDVKIQVEFNPANVKGYRLVGYENRALADEDFANDAKDAGEIGAGHTMTALYEIITNDSDAEVPQIDLKYQDDTSAEIITDELLTVSIRYKEPDGDTSKLCQYPVKKDIYSETMSKNLNFAAGVAEFGMVLRDSEYKGSATCQSVLTLLADYDYEDDVYKDEFIYLVKTMKRQGY